MADVGVKKVVIKSADLPYVKFDIVYNAISDRDEIGDLYYSLRYRIVSEDKNRYSHWAPVKKFVMPDVTTPFPYTASNRFTLSKAGNPEVITAFWSKPSVLENPSDYEKIFNKINVYDVWIRWNENNTEDLEDIGWSEWEYASTVSANSFSVLKLNSLVKRVEVAIQIPTVVKLRDYNNNKLTLFRGISATI